MYLNRVQIIGNITKDIELKALPSGSAVASFSVATNRTWKDKDGQKQTEVEYHSVTAFGKTAELIKQYMGKGSKIYIEGRLKTRSWEDKKTGEKKYKTEVMCENMQFGNNKPKAQESTSSAVEDMGEVNADDIPF